jgi:hypothetical protein
MTSKRNSDITEDEVRELASPPRATTYQQAESETDQAWADSQHRLYADYQGEFDLDDVGHAAAINWAAEPRAGEYDQDWAGPGFTTPGPEPAPEHPGGGHQAEAGS